MPKFQPGDRVERIDSLLPDYMGKGTVIRVIEHPDLPDDLTEYEVNFKYIRMIAYQRQLRLSVAASSARSE